MVILEMRYGKGGVDERGTERMKEEGGKGRKQTEREQARYCLLG